MPESPQSTVLLNEIELYTNYKKKFIPYVINENDVLSNSFIELFGKLDKLFTQILEVKNELSEQTLLLINNQVNQINNYLKSLQNQTLNEISPYRQQHFDSLNNKLKDLKSFSAIIQALLQENENENLRKEFQIQKKEFKEFIDKRESEYAKLNAEYKELFLGATVLKQEEIYLKSSNSYNKQSKYWLIAVILTSLVLILTILLFLNTCWINYTCAITNIKSFDENPNLSSAAFYYEIIRKSILRLLIISLIIYLLKFIIKNYNAVKHNSAINEQKANSFAAALHLSEKTSDDGKNKILDVAAREIFSQHKTGYLHKDGKETEISLINKLLSVLNKNE